MADRVARVESRVDAGIAVQEARPEIHDPARRRDAFIGFGAQTSAHDRISAMEVIMRDHFPGMKPVVGFTETFLAKTKPAELSGYVQIACLDRQTGEKCGGIMLFAKKGFDNAIVHVGDSEAHERSWFVVYSDRGAILLGLWYRRPVPGETASIASLHDELERFGEGTIQTIIMGDINVHEISWLKYSNGSTLEGRELLAFANMAGLSERVGKPTRGPNLLDEVLSDLGTELTCAVHHGINDREAVVVTVRFNIPKLC